MAQTQIITLTNPGGPDAGPYNIIAINGSSAITNIAFNVSRATLTAGYTASNIPDDTVIIRVQSNNANCTNFVDIAVSLTTTTSTTTTTTTVPPTTTTTTSTTTTTTTPTPTTTSTTTTTTTPTPTTTTSTTTTTTTAIIYNYYDSKLFDTDLCTSSGANFVIRSATVIAYTYVCVDGLAYEITGTTTGPSYGGTFVDNGNNRGDNCGPIDFFC